MDDFWNSTLRIASVDLDGAANGNGFLPTYVGTHRSGNVRIEKRNDHLQVTVPVPGGTQHDHFIRTKRISRGRVICFICATCRLPRQSLYLTYASDRKLSAAFECRACACKTGERLRQKGRVT